MAQGEIELSIPMQTISSLRLRNNPLFPKEEAADYSRQRTRKKFTTRMYFRVGLLLFLVGTHCRIRSDYRFRLDQIGKNGWNVQKGLRQLGGSIIRGFAESLRQSREFQHR